LQEKQRSDINDLLDGRDLQEQATHGAKAFKIDSAREPILRPRTASNFTIGDKASHFFRLR
jgi:hypothetical protein